MKPCLSNYCTFHMLPQMNTTNTKYCNIHEKNIFLVDILSLLLVRSKIFINITSDVFHCHAPGENLLECSIHGFQQRHLILWSMIISTSMLKKNYSIGFKNGEYGASPPFSKNCSDCNVGNLHIYAPKLDWLNG